MAVYHESTDDATCEQITLLDSLSGEWLKLSYSVMRDCGPACQTLAGLLRITSRETYTYQAEIVQYARLPRRKMERHLVTLHKSGWIVNAGRQCTRSGRLRRTATIKVTSKTRDNLVPFGILPWWACCNIRKVGRLPWCVKAVLSTTMAELSKLKAAAERDGEIVVDLGDIEAVVGDLEGRFRFSLADLERKTGLDHKSITAAKRYLYRHKIIRWSGGDGSTDLLLPNEDFHVIDTPTGEGKCYLAFG